MMKKVVKQMSLAIAVCLLIPTGGCEKFLDEKTDVTLAVPKTLKDLQALLDTYYAINEVDPSADEVSAGEFYVTDADFGTRSVTDQRLYTWQNDNVLAERINDWHYSYTVIYRCNSVLENIDQLAVNNQNSLSFNNVKGQALFHRARAYLQAVNIWGKVYDPATAATELGVPIRAGVNFNEPSVRATIQQNYNLIVDDLKQAISLLPDRPVQVMRPSKAAATGLLARTYLWMGDYPSALNYTNLCLGIKNDLMDFNTLIPTATQPIAQFNLEVLFASRMNSLPIIALSRAKIIPGLYNSYVANDLRKVIYFRDNGNGSYGFKGSYDGTSLYFSGVATDEVYLTRAECQVRLGNVGNGLADLNSLLRKRYRTGTFVDYAITNQAAALQLVLQERRKELLLRGLRWADIKRLNREGANISLSRIVNGTTYSLTANSARFAIPIPDDIIVLSGIPQNSY